MNETKLVPNDRMCKYELDNYMQNVARPCKPAELLFNRQQMTNAHILGHDDPAGQSDARLL